MNNLWTTMKRLITYITGLFLLALGATFSILAGLGVSPVTSLPYALSLITPYSVGMTTIAANILFIIIQMLLLRTIQWKNFTMQLIITFIFGFFMDATVYMTSFLPVAHSPALIALYFALSLVLVALALTFYFTSTLPMMPYDSLTYVIATKWTMPFSKAKITSDVLNVLVALALCLLFTQQFGAIGIGTFMAAYAIGKLVGLCLAWLQPPVKKWIFAT